MKTTNLFVIALSLATAACSIEDQRTAPQGQNGDVGPKGDVGPSGKDGKDGAQGATGATGTPGVDGVNGVDGLPGQKGDKGDKGDTGQKGDKGDKGDTGATGLTGPAGKDGVNATPYTDAMAQAAAEVKWGPEVDALKEENTSIKARLATLEAFIGSNYCTANSQCRSNVCQIATGATAGVCVAAPTTTPPGTMAPLGVTAVGLTSDKVDCWNAAGTVSVKGVGVGLITCPAQFDASLVVPSTVTGGICTGERGLATPTAVHVLILTGGPATWQGCQR